MSQPSRIEAGIASLRGINELLLLTLNGYRYSAPELLEAAQYAVSSPGHRWRPLLFVEIWKTFTNEGELPKHHLGLVTAIEYLHTASIILDDLPAMDDGTLRRGQAPCHIKFGQGRAILTALWLCDVAQSLLHAWRSVQTIDVDVEELFRSVKTEMMNGQVLDLESGANATLAQLVERSRLKSGALYGFTASLPVLILGVVEAVVPLRAFGNYLGIAYQISDDILDCVAVKDEIGKDVRRDRNTIPRLYGLTRAMELKQEYKEKAVVELRKGLTPCEKIVRMLDEICV
jgi:geranylgeranyl pyrophosphate synthase